MSSGFVPARTANTDDPERQAQDDDEWLRAEADLEASRRQRAEQQDAQANGKSLYEVLQENKAAKQEAFQESIRLKHQFRTLDEDEVEFLDAVLESTRAEEAKVKEETMKQLELFHRQREEAEKLEARNLDPSRAIVGQEEENWAMAGRKRRRRNQPGSSGSGGGVKLRKASGSSAQRVGGEEKDGKKEKKEEKQASPQSTSPSSEKKESDVKSSTAKPEKAEADGKKGKDAAPQASSKPEQKNASPSPPPPPAVSLGLVAYSSDED